MFSIIYTFIFKHQDLLFKRNYVIWWTGSCWPWSWHWKSGDTGWKNQSRPSLSGPTIKKSPGRQDGPLSSFTLISSSPTIPGPKIGYLMPFSGNSRQTILRMWLPFCLGTALSGSSLGIPRGRSRSLMVVHLHSSFQWGHYSRLSHHPGVSLGSMFLVAVPLGGCQWVCFYLSCLCQQQGFLQSSGWPNETFANSTVPLVSFLPGLCNRFASLRGSDSYLHRCWPGLKNGVRALPKVPSSKEIAEAVLFHVFQVHSLPQDVVSDWGRQFATQLWKEFSRLLRVSVSLSSGFHPEIDDQTKSIIRRRNQPSIPWSQKPLGCSQHLLWVEPQLPSCGIHQPLSIPVRPWISTSISPYTGEGGCSTLGPCSGPSLPPNLEEGPGGSPSHHPGASEICQPSRVPWCQVGQKVWLSMHDLLVWRECRKPGPRFMGLFTKPAVAHLDH